MSTVDTTNVCRICIKEKSTESFYKDKSKKKGNRNECKDCAKIIDKKKQEKNKEKIKQKRAKSYLKNKGKIKEKIKEYYLNTGKIKEKERNYKLQKQLFELMGNK